MFVFSSDTLSFKSFQNVYVLSGKERDVQIDVPLMTL